MCVCERERGEWGEGGGRGRRDSLIEVVCVRERGAEREKG